MTTATVRPDRIVDAHVHLWDPARTDWYPYLSGGMKLDLGNVTGMARRFDVATYLAEYHHNSANISRPSSRAS